MTPARYQFLRWLFISLGIIHLVAVGIAYIFYSHTLGPGTINPITTPFSWWSGLVMTIILTGLGIVLAILLKRPSYHLFLAAFLIVFGSEYTWSQCWGWTSNSYLLPTVHATLTAALFIYSMLRFAGYRSPEAYQLYFTRHKRPAWYKKTVIFFAQDKLFWFVLVPLLLILSLLSQLISNSMVYVINILILFIGLVYFRISYNFSGKQNQSRLAWLLWGLISCIVLYIINLFLMLLYPELRYARLASYILICLVICFSFIMAIFFYGSTDAHIVVRKTIIYSALFLTGLFIFGVLEHFVVHIIGHALHIKNSILNSCLGAAIALLIRPLHNKVEHRLEKWEKKKKTKVEQGKISAVAK